MQGRPALLIGLHGCHREDGHAAPELAAAQRAGILKRVTPTALRDTYAVRRLMAGDNIRAVQQALGHHSVGTTLRYQACLPPKVASPADPDSPKLALKQMAAVLQRLTTTIPTAGGSAPSTGCRWEFHRAPAPSAATREADGRNTAPRGPTFQQGP